MPRKEQTEKKRLLLEEGTGVKEDIKLVVYGNMKKGYKEHCFLAKSEYLNDILVSGFIMGEVGEWPVIFKGRGVIQGELYNIPYEEFIKIQAKEEEKGMKKEEIFVNSNKAYIFVGAVRSIPIPSGVWFKGYNQDFALTDDKIENANIPLRYWRD